jgi:drug/metabolite transporter (DMT)-like permease
MPATALTYVLAVALAKYILKEHIGWRRWDGRFASQLRSA